MSENVDVRITLSLHPDGVTGLEYYCDETAAVLEPARKAFQACYSAVQDTHNAREFAAANPAWTEASQIIQTDNLARKHLDKLGPMFDNVRQRLIDNIANIEGELTTHVVNKANLGLAQEIRLHVKGLETSERMKLIRKLIIDGDESATAVLGGPAFLSGLTDDMHEAFTQQYNERNSPGAMLRLKAMRSAVDLIERNAPLMWTAFEKAVGCPAHKAAALRQANTAAEKAMALRDLPA